MNYDHEMPWCEPCGSWHHATAPGCRAPARFRRDDGDELFPESAAPQAETMGPGDYVLWLLLSLVAAGLVVQAVVR